MKKKRQGQRKTKDRKKQEINTVTPFLVEQAGC